MESNLALAIETVFQIMTFSSIRAWVIRAVINVLFAIGASKSRPAHTFSFV
jgi:hypothetical protein